MEDKLAIYDKFITEHSDFERKGKTMFLTSANGYMFSQLNKAGEIGIRLSKEDTQFFSQKYDIKPFMSYGAKMREYVLIPETTLQNDWEYVVELLKRSFDYVNGLPTK